jgi:hypothetical protein
MSESGSPRRAFPGAQAARIAGYVSFLLFFGLGASSNGLHVTFHDSQTTSSPGELNLWLGHALLLFPGSLLIGYGFAEPLHRLIAGVVERVRTLGPRERIAGVIGMTLLTVAIARVGHAVFLLDFPITDDEYAVDFGGRILASGHVMAHLALPRDALPDLFLYFRDGAVGSFDWIGGQAIAAVAHLTGLGPFVWALVAAIPIPALAVLLGRRLGAHWGLAAAVLFLCSPMALLMSMTTHTQLASRAGLALAILAFWRADRTGGLRSWGLTGCWLGLAFLCRPLEVIFFSAPIAVWALFRAIRRTPEYRMAPAGLLLGAVPFVAIFIWHSYAMTGNPLLPARFAVPANTDVISGSLWNRFGDNVTYNTFMLAVWFLGPLGLVLVAAGALTDRFTSLLGICVAADLCLAFFHDNPGLHIVGPIHYSECAVPLTIIATHGLANLLRGARRHLFDARGLSASIAAALVLGLGTFTLVQALALRDQAAIQRDVYGTIEQAVRDPGGRKAVVLTPWLFAVVGSVPRMRDVGTWVHDWRRPRLDLNDDVLFLRDVRDVEAALRAQFPDRRFFRIRRDPRSPVLLLVPLEGGAPIPLTDLATSGR